MGLAGKLVVPNSRISVVHPLIPNLQDYFREHCFPSGYLLMTMSISSTKFSYNGYYIHCFVSHHYYYYYYYYYYYFYYYYYYYYYYNSNNSK